MKPKVLFWLGLFFVITSCARFSGIQHAQNGKFSYAFYAPKTPAREFTKSLFILFHPAGSSGEEYAEKWVPLVEKWGYVFAPTAGPETPYGSPEFEEKFFEELQNLENRLQIDQSRIVLIAESNGAIYGYRFLAVHPDLLKAAVFVSGSLEEKTFEQISEHKAQIKTKILIAHGTDDQTFMFEKAEKEARELKELGLDAEFKKMDGMQHGADPFCEDEIIKWIEQQI